MCPCCRRPLGYYSLAQICTCSGEWVDGWVVALRGVMPGEGPPLFTLCGNPFGVMTGCRPVCYSLATSIVESCAAARPLKGFVPPFAQRTFIIKTRVVLAPPLVLLAVLSCVANGVTSVRQQ